MFKKQTPEVNKRFQLTLFPHEEHYPFWAQGQLSGVAKINIFAQDNKIPLNVFDKSDIKNDDKAIKSLSTNPVSEFKLYFNNNDIEDIWIVITWGSN